MDSTMSNLNPKAANAIATSRQRFGSPLLLALLLMVPVRVGLPQTSLSSKGPVLSGEGSVLAQRQTLDDATDPGSGAFDSSWLSAA